MSRRSLFGALTAMGISAAGVGAIAAAVASPSLTTSAQEVQVHENTAKHIELHDQHLSHQGSGNADALNNDYAENAIVEDSMHREPFVGRSAIMGRKNLIFAAASDAQITLTNRIANGNQVTAECVATGRHTGDLPGLPASQRFFRLRGVTVVVRENGKIVRESLYYDVNELRRQLGHIQ